MVLVERQSALSQMQLWGFEWKFVTVLYNALSSGITYNQKLLNLWMKSLSLTVKIKPPRLSPFVVIRIACSLRSQQSCFSLFVKCAPEPNDPAHKYYEAYERNDRLKMQVTWWTAICTLIIATRSTNLTQSSFAFILVSSNDRHHQKKGMATFKMAKWQDANFSVDPLDCWHVNLPIRFAQWRYASRNWWNLHSRPRQTRK